jgi:hypothetical protein
MNSAPNIGFQELNQQLHFTMPAATPLDITRVALMAEMVRATAASHKIVIFWDVPQDSNYIGVKIFRSQERPLGDLGSIGEKMFDGYGITNAFEFRRTSPPDVPVVTHSPNLSQFLNGPPPEPQTKPVSIAPSNDRRPLAPAQLLIASAVRDLDDVRTLHYNNEYVVKSVYHFFRSVCMSPSFTLYDWPMLHDSGSIDDWKN